MESKYPCLIVDDEFPAHDVIKSFLILNNELEFKKSAYNGEDAVREIVSNNYDIVFLDINLPILNGIEVLLKLESKPAIIVTTAYTEFAFEAYQNDAIDYLQKPISYERFQKAIRKAIDYVEKKKLKESQFLKLKIDGLNQNIKQEDIIYCQSMGNYTKLFIQSTPKAIILKQPLFKQLNNLNPLLFFQIHRSFIVNKLFITQKKENVIVLKNNLELPLGRKYLTSVNSICK